MENYKQKEKIAFLLPVYNAENSIESTLISVLNQDYKFFKVYIINNGSTDNTEKIISKYALKDSRIQIHNQKKPNLSKALCLGLDIIKEEFIVRIDSGDTCDVNRIRNTLDFMKKNENCAISYTDYFVERNNQCEFNVLPKTINKKDFLFKNKIAHSTICLRNSFLKKLNLTYSGIGKNYLYFGPSQDLLILSLAIFIFNLEISKIPSTSSTITKNITNSISYLKKNKQRRIASIILLINNLIFFKTFKVLNLRILSILGIVINTIRLIRYGSILSFLEFIYQYKKNNLDDKLIYQKIINKN